MTTPTCRGCPHPPHLGDCTRRNGGTAYVCGCTAQTPTPSPTPTAPPDVVIAAAESAARESPCAKSARGAVIYEPAGAVYTSMRIVTVGYNGPPSPITCDGSPSCRRDCGKRCVHAEARAVRGLTPDDREWPGPTFGHLELVHVKLGEDGRLVAGGPPICWQCSREILDVGIGAVWLFERVPAAFSSTGKIVPSHGVWRRYTAEEFHRVTIKNCEVY